MSDQPTPSRSRLWRVLSIVWVVLISGFVLVDRVVVSHLSERLDANIDQLVMQSLEERVAAVEQHVEALQSAPSPVSQETFTDARQALDDRLARMEELAGNSARASDLLSLQERLSTIEARLARARTSMRPAAPTRAPATVLTDLAPPDPPFTVLGIEWRGGKHFLSLAPAGVYSLDAVGVLQPGESYEDWHLEALDGKAAVFRVAGRSQRVTVL